MKIPHLITNNTFPLNLEDKIHFVLSKWNYFIKDKENNYVAGYWEAAEGELPFSGEDDFSEIIIVLSGKIQVECNGKVEDVYPGECICLIPGRPVKMKIKEKVVTFFIEVPVENVEHIEDWALERVPNL